MNKIKLSAMLFHAKENLPQIIENAKCNFQNINGPYEGYGVEFDKDGNVIGYSEVAYRARLFTCIWITAKESIALLVCAFAGHNIVDEGYGNENSGCIDLHCTRCDWNHHTTLY